MLYTTYNDNPYGINDFDAIRIMFTRSWVDSETNDLQSKVIIETTKQSMKISETLVRTPVR